MKLLLLFAVLLILVVVFANTISVKGQAGQGYVALSAVPDDERAGLSERLKSLIEYQSSEQWDKVYELWPNPKKESKESFVRGNRKTTKLEAFVPRNAAVTPTSNAWWITGCATFRKNGVVRERPALTKAIKQDGEWYLSPIGIFPKELEEEPSVRKLCSK